MNNLIYSKKKTWFEEELNNIPENAIAFIGDTKEIYAQGQYFGGGYTKEEIDAQLGDINAALDYIINGPKQEKGNDI